MPKGYYKSFTVEDEEKIKKEYLTKSTKKLSEELGVSFGRIKRFLDRNNLKIPDEVLEKRIANSRIKKGNIPFNKGKKINEYMSAEKIEKIKKTQFKKGDIPFNSKYNGAITERKDSSGINYKYIRVSIGEWELYHRYLWKKAHGEIPKNGLIVFKDGNQKNLSIDNLKLITPIEHMYNNSYHNYPKEIIPSLTLNKQLEHKLKQIENGKQ